MNFKEKFLAVLSMLGLVDKAKAKALGDADWSLIESTFKEKHGISITEAMQQSAQAEQLQRERNAVLAILGNEPAASDDNQPAGSADAGNEDVHTEASLVDRVQSLVTALENSNQENNRLRETLNNLAMAATEDKPLDSVKNKLTVYGPGTTDKFLFGLFYIESRRRR